MIYFKCKSLDEEIDCLKFGLEISKQIGRIFILPKFSSKYCSRINKNIEQCNYATYFSIRQLNKYYGEDNVRENVFWFNLVISK